jgi:hypothetical protein
MITPIATSVAASTRSRSKRSPKYPAPIPAATITVAVTATPCAATEPMAGARASDLSSVVPG